MDWISAHFASITPKFLLDLTIDYGVFLVGALGLYLLMYAGQVSLGHAAVIGLCAYASGVMAVKLALPFGAVIVLTGLVGAATGAIYCLLLGWRLGGFYLAIGTFALGEMLINLALNSDYLGGAIGLSGIPLASEWPIVAVAVALTLLVVWRIERSHLALRFRSIRDNPIVAGAMGVNVARTKLTVWIIAGVITGVAGCLHAHRVTVITPTEFGIYSSVTILMAPLLGGLRTFWGTVLGAAVVHFGPWLTTTSEPRDRLMFYGALIVALMVWRPQGLLVGRPKADRARAQSPSQRPDDVATRA